MGMDEIIQIVCREKPNKNSFIHSINLLSTDHVPGAGNITVNMNLPSTDGRQPPNAQQGGRKGQSRVRRCQVGGQERAL